MIPLFSNQQIREMDEFAINKLKYPSIVLMENAARSIFEILNNKILLAKKIKMVGAVCGKGNNGGDGFAVLRHIANAGYKVNVVYVGDPKEMSPDCLTNFKILRELGNHNKNILLQKYYSLKDINLLARCDIIIDAMLGSGTTGDLRKPYDEIVNTLNKLKTTKIAIDIPTGLDSDTGYGKIIFNSDLTITLSEFKKGLFFNDGYTNCGKVIKGSIGLDENFYDNLDIKDFLVEPEDALEFLPKKKKSVHKYSAGKVLTIAGSGSFPGAAALTARSALKIGAGSSILVVPKSIRKFIYKKVNEVVLHPYEDEGSEFLSTSNIKELREKIKWADAVAIGPGLGREEETIEAVLKILKERLCPRFVIDADAIFALSNGKFKDIDLHDFMLTPHYGEFANLIDVELSELKKNILQFGTNFSTTTGSYLVLKGAPTIIFSPDGEKFINCAGNPGMAKFGTGDVLTGVLAGLIAQSEELENAIVSGVYLHSLSADLLLKYFTEYSFTAEDIIKNLPKAITFLRKSFA